MAKGGKTRKQRGGTHAYLVVKVPQMTQENAQEIKQRIEDTDAFQEYNDDGELQVGVNYQHKAVKFTAKKVNNNILHSLNEPDEFLDEVFDGLDDLTYTIIERPKPDGKRRANMVPHLEQYNRHHMPEIGRVVAPNTRLRLEADDKRVRDVHAKSRLTMRERHSAVLGYAKKPVRAKFTRRRK